MIDTDGEPFPWSNAQAAQIARVVRRICKRSQQRTLADDAREVVTTLLQTAVQVEKLTIYGETGERYEAAFACAGCSTRTTTADGSGPST